MGRRLYGASKAFLLSLCDALHYELGRHGVGVTALAPGATVGTEFAEKSGSGDATIWLLPADTATSVAASGAAAMFSGKRRVVPPSPMALLFYNCGQFFPVPLALLAAAVFWVGPSSALASL